MADPSPVARLPWYAVLTGAIILLGFSWLAYLMVEAALNLGEKEQYRWDRLLLVFNSVQTLTVAAAGALLGTAVQQGRVASAEARADAAGAAARANQSDAAKAETARKLVEGLDPPGNAPTSEQALLNQLKVVLS
jgi:hypothetical protein